MKRRRSEDDGRTQPRATLLEGAPNASPDAIFRSFVERNVGIAPTLGDHRVATAESTSRSMKGSATAERAGVRANRSHPQPSACRDAQAEQASGETKLSASFAGFDQEPPPSDATDPRMQPRWTETAETLLDSDRHETRRVEGPSISQPPRHAEDASRTCLKPDAALPKATKAASREPHPRLDDDDDAITQVVSPSPFPRPSSRPPAADPRSERAPMAVEAPPIVSLNDGGEDVKSSTAASDWKSVVRVPSEATQRREALRLVPDVAHVPVEAPPAAERSEDGMVPSGLLDRTLSDMAVLLRYGHEAQVRQELDALRARYPQDLLLARRIAEFYVANGRAALALEQLFALATALFERRNIEGMRQALEQVLVIEPSNERALRLLALLDRRPSEAAMRGRERTR